ncbi:MAG: hypothetical protein S4CHLAM102_10270 [Chlamydiia bacterium]|nr:hypothetical protein [Chlamydiia bacterium]
MSRLFSLLVILVGFAPVGGWASMADECGRYPYVVVEADATLLRRGGQKGHCLVDLEDSSGTNYGCAWSNNKLSRHDIWTWGLRGAIRINPDMKSSIEAAWMGLDEWHPRKLDHSPEKLFHMDYYNNNTTDFKDAAWVQTVYKSRFSSYELSYIGWATPPKVDYFAFAWSLGARHINIYERFMNEFFRTAVPSYYKISTKNQYWGGQLGINLDINPTPWLTTGFLLKGGVLINHAKMHAFQTDKSGGEIIRNANDLVNVVGYLGEIRPFMTISPLPYCSLQIAYEGLMVSSCALAPMQIPFNSGSGNTIYKNSTPTYSGLFLGGSIQY